MGEMSKLCGLFGLVLRNEVIPIGGSVGCKYIGLSFAMATDRLHRCIGGIALEKGD